MADAVLSPFCVGVCVGSMSKTSLKRTRLFLAEGVLWREKRGSEVGEGWGIEFETTTLDEPKHIDERVSTRQNKCSPKRNLCGQTNRGRAKTAELLNTKASRSHREECLEGVQVDRRCPFKEP